jgi:hypothetical protein
MATLVTRTNKRFILFVLVGFVAQSLLGCSADNSTAANQDEKQRPDEQAQADRAAANFVHIVDKNKATYVGRGAHAKGHSCVKAYFNVLDQLDPKYRYGVFSRPGRQYQAWIRFSNANSNYAQSRDINKDAHGMAIKLLGIDGEPLATAGHDGRKTQDFLMADNPAFFSANIDDYNKFLETDNYIHFFFNGVNPFRWRIREFFIALDTLKTPPGSPQWISYYSNTAYKLGPQNIKFSAQPCSTGRSSFSPDKNNPDFMRDNLARELAEGNGCFEFKVQLQAAGGNMPVEDPSVEWDEGLAPFVTVASVMIPEQAFNSPDQVQFCENLSFSPWHALEAHRPLGQFNRIRRTVYQASSDYRHAQNRTEVPQDIEW